MPTIIEKTVYSFNELSESAKDTARDWYRSGDDMDFAAEHVIEDAATIADILGIELRTRPVKLIGGGTLYEPCIYYSGFWSQGDGACFKGDYRYRKGALNALRAHIGGESKGDKELLRIAKGLQTVQSKYFYSLRADMHHSGHYMHSGCMRVNVDYLRDDSRDISEAEDAITEYMRDFSDWIYKQLEAAYDYHNSNEVVDENIICNEYDFDENGKRI